MQNKATTWGLKHLCYYINGQLHFHFYKCVRLRKGRTNSFHKPSRIPSADLWPLLDLLRITSLVYIRMELALRIIILIVNQRSCLLCTMIICKRYRESTEYGSGKKTDLTIANIHVSSAHGIAHIHQYLDFCVYICYMYTL